jgi:RNA-directed DNA polymerase
LGIPTVRDRVVQMAVLLVIEPIFEADFEDCSYGFRPGRSAHQALDQSRATVQGSRQTVYEDLASYFDTIDHARLLQQLERRVADGSVLRLIRQWLRCPVLEDDGRGGTSRTTPTRGTPQGGVLSPLLANIYLHDFDRAFHGPDGPAQFARARLVRYADDFAVLAKYMGPRLTAWLEHPLEDTLGLRLNRDKTRTIRVSATGGTLDFLGFTFRWDRDRKGRDRRYLNVVPSAKALGRIRDKLRALTPRGKPRPLGCVVQEVNTLLRGWATYFRYGYPRAAFRALNHFVRGRFRTSPESEPTPRAAVPGGGTPLRWSAALWAPLPVSGPRVVNSVRCSAATDVREPDAGNLHVRFDEGERLPRSLLDRSTCAYGNRLPGRCVELDGCPRQLQIGVHAVERIGVGAAVRVAHRCAVDRDWYRRSDPAHASEPRPDLRPR